MKKYLIPLCIISLVISFISIISSMVNYLSGKIEDSILSMIIAVGLAVINLCFSDLEKRLLKKV